MQGDIKIPRWRRRKQPKLPRFNQELLRQLGFEDWREFAIDLGTWAEQKDFTYQGALYDPTMGANYGVFINAYLQEKLAQNAS